ncbi:MAG: DUF4251 domain-containing protein [Flavobacteriales bacterium]|nr:DUF4251 domain-containing protein [Flavobacteriales bacterium]
MKRVIFFFIAISALVACGPSKPLSPEEQAELNVKKAKYRDIFQSQSFALEANTVYNKKGQSMHVNSTINFVLLKEGTGTLQLGFDQLVGWNGVGGITLDGNVKNYEVIEGSDRQMPKVKFDMNGVLGWATVNISVNSSGMARATIDGNFGERITFSGPIYSLEESHIYKGSSLF